MAYSRYNKLAPFLTRCRRVKSGGGAVYLLSGAGLLACKDVRLLAALSCSCPPPSPFDKLRYIDNTFAKMGVRQAG
jgi:hypothetical protein